MNIEQILGWAYSYACNLADIGLDIRNIEVPAILTQAENDRIIDNRPLTEETLRGLGFELKADGRWVFIYRRKNKDKPAFDIKLRQGGNLFNVEINGIHQYKTVGSVRMLIEALKGEIK